jgi:effector-binding domain-containing protein
MREEKVMVATTDIERRHLDGATIAYQQFRGTVPSIESVTSGVRSWVVTMGFKPQGPMAIEVTGEPSEDLAQEYDVEVQLPVSDNAKSHPSDKVQIKRFEPADAVVMTLHGPHELTKLAAPLARMTEWMQGQNLQPGPVVRWVEVTDPAKVSPEEQVTEVQYLLRQ